MYSLWNYFSTPIIDDIPNIHFGKWACQLDYLDCQYNRLATRLIKFAKEAGKDPYNRYFNFEPLVDFALEKDISTKSTDYIYRHYVYNLVSQHDSIDIEQEELNYLIDNFVVIQ